MAQKLSIKTIEEKIKELIEKEDIKAALEALGVKEGKKLFLCERCDKSYLERELDKTLRVEFEVKEKKIGYAIGYEWETDKIHIYPKDAEIAISYSCPKCKNDIKKEVRGYLPLKVNVKKVEE